MEPEPHGDDGGGKTTTISGHMLPCSELWRTVVGYPGGDATRHSRLSWESGSVPKQNADSTHTGNEGETIQTATLPGH